MDNLVQSIVELKNQKKKVLLVSSGAVGFGKAILKKKIKIHNKPSLVYRQALASMGQGELIDMYRLAFYKFDIFVAQILVSALDFKTKEHYKNLKRCIDQLFEWDIIPIINENDPVATEELIGDNDTLAAFTATMYTHSFLILLTTVDGFYMNQKKRLFIEEITDAEMKHAGKPFAGGVGGMQTKLEAAQKIIKNDRLMNISNGNIPNVIKHIMKAKDTGTWFLKKTLNSC